MVEVVFQFTCKRPSRVLKFTAPICFSSISCIAKGREPGVYLQDSLKKGRWILPATKNKGIQGKKQQFFNHPKLPVNSTIVIEHTVN
jgi:hypothetical protein